MGYYTLRGCPSGSFLGRRVRRLETGRTHQIRLHMASIGHPLFGDPLYGVRDGGTRAALHAWKLHFLQPMTGEPIDLENIRTHMFD